MLKEGSALSSAIVTRRVGLEVEAGHTGRRNVFVVGHRGAPSLAPENTIPSFLKAIEGGADFVEFDVRRTIDDEPVVIHDGTVDRTTDSKGVVSEFTLRELKKLDAGGWFSPEFREARIPTMEETLAVAEQKAWVVVHIKEVGVEEDVVKLLTERHMVHQSVIIADHPNQVVPRLRELEPRIPIEADIRVPLAEPGKGKTIALGDIADMSEAERHEIIHESIGELLRYQANIASLHKSTLVIPDLIKLCHKRGLTVNAWPVNEVDEISACIDAGVDFITSDNPRLVVEMLGAKGSTRGLMPHR